MRGSLISIVETKRMVTNESQMANATTTTAITALARLSNDFLAITLAVLNKISNGLQKMQPHSR